MSRAITIALDAMGGDQAPEWCCAGADIALQRYPNLRLIAIRRRGRRCAAARQAAAPRRCGRAASHDEIVSGDDKPSHRAAHRAPVEHAAGDRCGRGRARRWRRFGRQYRRADGDGEIRAEDVAGHRPPGDRLVLSDPARRERDARSRRQCRMRCRESGSVRADGRRLCPHACWVWSSPRSGLLNVGSEDQKGNDAVRAAVSRLRGALSADPLLRLRRGRRHRRRHGRCRRHRRFHRQHRAQDRRRAPPSCSANSCASLSRIRCWRGSAISSPAARCVNCASGSTRAATMARCSSACAASRSRAMAATDALGFANAIGVAVDMKVNGFLEKIRADLARLEAGDAGHAPAGRAVASCDGVALPDPRLRRLSARADRHQ